MESSLLRNCAMLCILALTAASNGRAGSLDSTVIGMFPRDAGDFGYADLSQARQLPWYPQLSAQVIPVALFGFEQFLEAVQMRQSSSINEVAWATVSAKAAARDASPSPSHATSGYGQPVAVAIGEFDTDTIKSYLDSKSIPSIQAGNYVLYASGTGVGTNNVFFTLLDSHTIVFGPLEPLKRVLRIREGEEDNLLQNEAMMNLIESANGNGLFWGVLNSGGAARAIDRLVPEAAKFPQSRELIEKFKQVLITVTAKDNIELEFQAALPSPSDAVLISQLLQAGVLLRGYQTKSDKNPDLAAALDGLRISANGNSIDISLQLTNDQLLGMIEHNTFSMKM